MNDSKRIWPWVGVVVVVVAIVVWAGWEWNATKQVASGPVPVYAPQGQLVPQFPKELILDSKAAVSGSYSINYASTTNQYTAEYTSSSSMKMLFGKYQSYLSTSTGWTIAGTITNHPTFEAISASQGANQLEVVISAEGKGSQAAITYVAK